MPKLIYLLRSSPTFQHPDIFADFDDCLKSYAIDVCIVLFGDIFMIQATLPIRHGSIGLRRASDMAHPAYLAGHWCLKSHCQTASNMRWILALMCDRHVAHHHLKTLLSNVSGTTSNQLIALLPWDYCLTSMSLFGSTSQFCRRMKCLPSTTIGTLPDIETFRIPINQRLGFPICPQHKCRCRGTVDKYGLHHLSFRISAGRSPRHSALNDIIKRGICWLQCSYWTRWTWSWKWKASWRHDSSSSPRENVSFGILLMSTFSHSALALTAIEPGSVAPSAEVRKSHKYEGLCDWYIFKQTLINPLVWLDDIEMHSFPGWVT